METQMLLNKIAEKYIALPWEAIEGTVNILQLFLVYVPAITIFLFYKLSMINIWIKEVTTNGCEIMLHNKTKQTIQISKIILNFDNAFFDKIPEVCDNTNFLLKPDEYTNIRISYKKHNLKNLKLKLIVHYNKIHRKTIKVRI